VQATGSGVKNAPQIAAREFGLWSPVISSFWDGQHCVADTELWRLFGITRDVLCLGCSGLPAP
jgi:hypothetical protein